LGEEKYMKKIIYTTIFVLTFCIFSFGQEPKTKSAPVPGLGPHIVTNEQFENLDMPAQLDRFGKIDDKQKKFHLDMFTSIISMENKTVEYVVQLKGKTPKDVSQNMEFIYRYLTENKKIKPSRLSFAIIPESENETELWLIPNKDIAIPGCKDCVIISAEDEEKLKEYFQVKKAKK
jgi:ribosomal protein S18